MPLHPCQGIKNDNQLISSVKIVYFIGFPSYFCQTLYKLLINCNDVNVQNRIPANL